MIVDPIDVAVRAAARFGLVCTPSVLADRSHVVVALEPHLLVARVALATSSTGVGLRYADRELRVAAHLDAAGVPTTRPSVEPPPGPHTVDGALVSFWQRETLSGVLDPAEVGRTLAAAHRALRSIPAEGLPVWGVLDEARRVLPRARAATWIPRADVAVLEAAFEALPVALDEARARTGSFQAVHGDLHAGNLLPTARGAVLTDWEDASLAPVEWDLATFAARHLTFGEESAFCLAALAAYDGAYDPTLAAALVALRNLQVIPWMVVFAERDPSLRARVRARLDAIDRLRTVRWPAPSPVR